MRIELRDNERQRIGRVVIDPSARPTRVVIDSEREGEQEEVYLNWDSALDDAGHLRSCVNCGCSALFAEKAFPQITGLVVVVAFAGAILGLLDLLNTAALLGMAVVLILDIWILLFSTRRLVCYSCRTSYHELAIARYHRSWDRTVADRHPPPEPPDKPPTRRPVREWAARRLKRRRKLPDRSRPNHQKQATTSI